MKPKPIERRKQEDEFEADPDLLPEESVLEEIEHYYGEDFRDLVRRSGIPN